MAAPIAHYGTFDVANYGDLLFPLLIEHRLGDLAPLLHVSPVGGPPPIAGGVASIPPSAVPDRLAGVVVGGGHLIHASPSSLPAYQTPPALALRAYPALWLGAADRALRAGAPLVWNAPGVPGPIGARAAPILAWSTGFADYVALRDARSRELVARASPDASQGAEVVPDTGLGVADLFGASALDRAYQDAFAARGVERAGPTVALHANARYLRGEVELVAARIERLCAVADAQPILLALGPCHGDDALARALGHALDRAPGRRGRSPALVVDAPRSLVELAACIARSTLYVGSSLHGCITACAFGVRAAIVAREPGDGGKFSGFLGAFGLEAWLWRDWEEAEARVPALLTADPEPWQRVPRAAAPDLARHWARLRAALASPPRRPEIRSTARARIEDRIRADLDDFGVHAALLTHQAELGADQLAQLARQRAQSSELKSSYRAAARRLRARIAELEAADHRSDEHTESPDTAD